MPGLPLAAGEGTGRGPAASLHILISPHPMSAAVGSRTCWDHSADQTFPSLYSISMDIGDPKFSVGGAGRQLFTLVFCRLGSCPGCLSTSECPRSKIARPQSQFGKRRLFSPEVGGPDRSPCGDLRCSPTSHLPSW